MKYEVPPGYKLVPIDPTEEMLEAVVETPPGGRVAELLRTEVKRQAREDWSKMITAAPEYV